MEKVAELTDLPSVTFSVTIRARCHPGTLSKVGFKFDWFTVDAKAGGDPVWAPVEGLPATLEGYEKNEAASDDKTEVTGSLGLLDARSGLALEEKLRPKLCGRRTTRRTVQNQQNMKMQLAFDAKRVSFHSSHFRGHTRAHSSPSYDRKIGKTT